MEATADIVVPNRVTRRTIAQLCRPSLERSVARLDADHGVRRYDTVGFAIAWLCLALMDSPTIRRLRELFDLNETVRDLVGWESHISIAQSTRLQHCRPVEIWCDLLSELLARARGQLPTSELRVMDTSFFSGSLKLLSRQYPTKAMDPATAGIKMGTVMDPDAGTPELFVFRVGQDSDSGWADTLIAEDEVIAGRIYVFDRGFRKYAFYDRIIDGDAQFITRATAMIAYRDVESRALDPAHPEILSDDVVLLGSDKSRNPMRNPVRRIVVKNSSTREGNKDKKDIVLLCSDLESPAHEIAEMYRRRWDIEVFFRWLKRTIGAANPPGYTMEAAIHWLCACLALYLILLICHQATADKPGKQAMPGFSRAMTRIRIAIDSQPPPELAGPLGALLAAMAFSPENPPSHRPEPIQIIRQKPDQLPAPKRTRKNNKTKKANKQSA